MSFNAYPVYRESGAAWLGDVPERWKVLPAKAVFVERKQPNLPDDTHLTPSQKHGVLAQSEYMALTGNKVVLNLSGSDAMRHVEPRDFISHLRSFQGGLELSHLRGKVSAAYTVLAPRSGVVVSYFKYLFKSTMYVQALQTTTDQLRDGQSIRYAQFARIPIPVPPSAEQSRIADYLDAQTAKIDALIEKQERLIETLAERRQAVISHAVTKGLDPSAQTRDSGLSWVGKVPVAWRVLKLGYVTDVLTGFAFKSDEYSADEADVRLLRGVNVNPGALAWRDVVFWPRDDIAAYSEYLLRSGDLILGLDRPIVSSGTRVARMTPDDLPALLLQRVARIRTATDLELGFLEYLLSGPEFRGYLEPIFTGVSVPHMSPDQLNSFRLALPTLAEQGEILEYLDRETSQIDALSAKAREMIDVLKERRQALISAAVTGKIDVRGLA